MSTVRIDFLDLNVSRRCCEAHLDAACGQYRGDARLRGEITLIGQPRRA